ncbi:b(o/a)3-type cytochrome-c oxidase subunit 1 [Paenibacillus koleovorans]|uniref:b(o/a)3-type cytochrome-c oxidase subunit 1 n=1 Tax=Paenibacillus koleovorans TaxID=121608 RepID=UPI000FD96CFA|nr:b(o/a)3-type cytochrome-c oxidase subunit 1 [Paenibacillus koleovorans]
METNHDAPLTNRKINPQDSILALTHILFAFGALALGGFAGLLQGVVKATNFKLPAGIGYYQLLTAHGVLMALVFTTFFIVGFLYAGAAYTTGGSMRPGVRRANWWGFGLMAGGTIMTVIMILLNQASVLYTFYAPLKASPFFYLGLTLVVVGSWISGIGLFVQYAHWRKQNPGKLSPLFLFMAVVTMTMWLICTLGVAAEVLLLLLPWSMGWVPTVNVMLSRTLFWYFGHPLVYFWLLPTYICWYVVIPKLIGGKVFSDSLARLSFILLLLFSIPVGFHHQLTEPGISPVWKFIQVVLTFMVVVPSLMTAFSLFAMLELSGRAKGAKRLFGWLGKLPWKDARFFAPFMGMVIFIPAGAGGIVNASNQMNQVVHNTIWVTGHFHLTVATSVALTFFGLMYWLVPLLSGRKLTPAMNKLGLAQTWIWVIGMFLMSGSMHAVGLLGSPRRTAYTTYGDHADALSWIPLHRVLGMGGVILFIGIILIIYIILELAFFAEKDTAGEEDFQVAEVAEDAHATPALLENWKVWVGIVVILILFAYTIPVLDMLRDVPGSKPWVTW